jgi:hypothetical protein
MIRPGGLLLVVLDLFAVPVSVLWVGLHKEYITKLGCEKYFHRIHILSTTGDALLMLLWKYQTPILQEEEDPKVFVCLQVVLAIFVQSYICDSHFSLL